MCTYACNLLRMAPSSSGVAIAKTERKHEESLTPNVSQPKTYNFFSLWFLTNDAENPRWKQLELQCPCPFFWQRFGGCWFCFCVIQMNWWREPSFFRGSFCSWTFANAFLGGGFRHFLQFFFLSNRFFKCIQSLLQIWFLGLQQA